MILDTPSDTSSLILSVQDGIKKMIHLIWTKDNNTTTTEDGKEIKGVRQKLLECYKTLYFEEVENLDPRGQVKRIAKNLVESVSLRPARRFALNALITGGRTMPPSLSSPVWRKWFAL